MNLQERKQYAILLLEEMMRTEQGLQVALFVLERGKGLDRLLALKAEAKSIVAEATQPAEDK